MIPTLDNKLVLIVDDTPTNVGVISGVLKGLYRTKVATNGEKALVLATAAEKPDLILLDVMMPGMDGLATLSALRGLSQTADTPVIFMTAKVQASEIQHYMRLGATDVIAKPFDPMTLSAQIGEIWQKVAG